jgi:superfamily II DNA or RNA helicase
MARLEDIREGCSVRGILPQPVTVEKVKWHGPDALEILFTDVDGRPGARVLYRDEEPSLEVEQTRTAWSFKGNGGLFRLVSEAHRIRLAHLFDPMLAVHCSWLEPLPHQITAVYESMLPRQPLRFLLADDPGAGKTIMAGLLIKELMARADVQRCLIVCPGSLVEQWQDELYRRFNLAFEIATNDKIEAAPTGNWFLENNLVIVRLDKAARDEAFQAKLTAPECQWDLVVVDEAHKMSAHYFGGEVQYTKRYKLGQALSSVTRHLLLLTATPHNGREEDFQLFLALLDGDRFEGRFRDGVHRVDVSDLMRRMVKEKLVRMDGTPLFPERYAHTIAFRLSDAEAKLYERVTDYVRNEFDRAEMLADEKRKGTVGFALTILQRRLASSPEAIYQSLVRRRERLESRLRELETVERGRRVELGPVLDPDELDEYEEQPDPESEEELETIVDEATASRTIEELRAEIDTLKELEQLALYVRRTGQDTKWRELSGLLEDLFTPEALRGRIGDDRPHEDGKAGPRPQASPTQKLVIFTEHRDTLNYLARRIRTVFAADRAVVTIHGGMGREERQKAQESFLYDPDVRVLVATDAAGEGINLQRAHVMVNYDLPWNPNRIEQRFGRIHRIGQTEECFLWNLVALETREGDVYYALLKKLEVAREQLGGQVFDVLGKLRFDGKPLREVIIEAIRNARRPEDTSRYLQIVERAADTSVIRELIEERALVHELIDDARLRRIREEMERAEARRLQPHYIESFFLEAFRHLGGQIRRREPGRYEITHVPSEIRERDRQIGRGEPVLRRYERVTFDKAFVQPPGQPLAAFIAPGHPLLNAVIDLILERYRDLLSAGAVLVDDSDPGTEPRLIVSIEHAIEDSTVDASGRRRTVSRRVLYAEVTPEGHVRSAAYAPYLDFRPLRDDEPTAEKLLQTEECRWITPEVEQRVRSFAIQHIAPEHLKEVRERRLDLIAKTRAAVQDRLTKEIAYWDHRAEELRLQEAAGRPSFRLNSAQARQRAEELRARLARRLQQLEQEEQLSALPPVVTGAFVVIPKGLIDRLQGKPAPSAEEIDRQAAAAEARRIVMEVERSLGYEPVDRETEHLGYDIESRDPRTGRLRFIEVKGRTQDATVITVTRNEILTALNKPDAYILAIVEFGYGGHTVHYVREPFKKEPDFGATSVNYDVRELLAKATPPS